MSLSWNGDDDQDNDNIFHALNQPENAARLNEQDGERALQIPCERRMSSLKAALIFGGLIVGLAVGAKLLDWDQRRRRRR